MAIYYVSAQHVAELGEFVDDGIESEMGGCIVVSHLPIEILAQAMSDRNIDLQLFEDAAFAHHFPNEELAWAKVRRRTRVSAQEVRVAAQALKAVA